METPVPTASSGKSRNFRERRAWPRYPKYIRVLLLAEDCAVEEPFAGWIIDTSRGGLRLRVPSELFPVGTLLHIRGPFASPRAPWTAVRVRNLRRRGDHWELGCEFVERASDTTRLSGPGKTRCDER
jgi:hypothetical protein